MRAARGAGGGRARSTSPCDRSPPTRSARAASANSISRSRGARSITSRWSPTTAIRAAQLALWREFSIVAEPGGAAAYSALASGAYRPAPGERVGVLLCGANADLTTFAAAAAL